MLTTIFSLWLDCYLRLVNWSTGLINWLIATIFLSGWTVPHFQWSVWPSCAWTRRTSRWWPPWTLSCWSLRQAGGTTYFIVKYLYPWSFSDYWYLSVIGTGINFYLDLFLPQVFFSIISTDPAAHQDQCGRFRIQTWGLCPRSHWRIKNFGLFLCLVTSCGNCNIFSVPSAPFLFFWFFQPFFSRFSFTLQHLPFF